MPHPKRSSRSRGVSHTSRSSSRPAKPAPARPGLAFEAHTPPLDVPRAFLDDCAAYGVELEPSDTERLASYLAMLLRANEHVNLTSVTSPADAWRKHIFDSLTLLPALIELPEGSCVIDVGSGGGLPGIPLAIALPALRFTLLEATGKKVEFLRFVIRALALTNVDVVQARAEQAGQDRGERTSSGSGVNRAGGHRERYDAVIARAVGSLNLLVELTVPFAKAPDDQHPGGIILLTKGQRADAELAHAAHALSELRAAHETTLDTPTGRIVILSKTARTPRIYPRPDGEPKRAPLGGIMPTTTPAE